LLIAQKRQKITGPNVDIPLRRNLESNGAMNEYNFEKEADQRRTAAARTW
jgi:hypothetical protein